MQPQALIEEIRRDRTVTNTGGEKLPIGKHGINAAEGRFLTEFIAGRPDIVRTLEVGCAYGLSSLHITSALVGRHGAHHVIVDPDETTAWGGIGVTNLDRAGIDFYELREEPSEIALPHMVKEGEKFDLAFIDGWHTFDQTLIDLYYANRLVKTGGYIIIDDADWISVSKAITYFAKYPCWKVVAGAARPVTRVINLFYRIAQPFAEIFFPRWLYDYVYALGKYPSMVALQKVTEDDRNWKWFRSF
jgi:predicted O-methyltransferase YrrM